MELAQASIYAEQSDYQQGAAYVQSLKTPAKSQQGCSWNPLAGNSCEGQGVSILGVGAGIAGDWVSDVGKVTEKNLEETYQGMAEFGADPIGQATKDAAYLGRAGKYLSLFGYAVQGLDVVQTLHSKGPLAAGKELAIDVASDGAGAVAGWGCEFLTAEWTAAASTGVCLGAAVAAGDVTDAALHNFIGK